jgi:hypothetical protein
MTFPPPRSNRAVTVLDGVEYAPGVRFEVVRDGARLMGMVPDNNHSFTYKSWRKYLAVGDVIECAGYGSGFGSDPGFGVEFRDPEGGLCEFHPWIGSAFNYRPEPGYLRPVE